MPPIYLNFRSLFLNVKDVYNFKKYRKTIDELEDDKLGHYNEDQQDDVFLDNMAFITPEIDSQRTRRGLSRMGSQTDFPTCSWRSNSHHYSVGSGYVPFNRVMVHGHKLSSVLERSQDLDPEKNIMKHILESESVKSQT